jgi:hypothetical protein
MFMLLQLRHLQVDAMIRTIHVQEHCRASCCHVQLIHDNNIIYMTQTNLLNNYILITQPYGKCKESYTSVRRTFSSGYLLLFSDNVTIG